MNVVDVIVLMAFIAIAVAGAEAVRLMCRRQLNAVPADPTAAPVEAAAVAAVGAIDAD
jgi:hypothetical protein